MVRPPYWPPFTSPNRARTRWPRLTDGQWREALAFSDDWQLTLALRRAAGEVMPPWVRERMDENAAHNLERHLRLEELYRCLAASFAGAGIEFVALKGLAHCPEFGSRPEERTQCDVDLYIPGENVYGRRTRYWRLATNRWTGLEPFPTDHLPTLIRKTGWQWRGDYFDPEIPVGIELHFQFWNDRVERLRVPDADEFWKRRVTRTIAGTAVSALCPADALAYASLHLLKHVLRGTYAALSRLRSGPFSWICAPPTPRSGANGGAPLAGTAASPGGDLPAGHGVVRRRAESGGAARDRGFRRRRTRGSTSLRYRRRQVCFTRTKTSCGCISVC